MIELIDKEEVLKIIDEAGDTGEAHGSINYNCNPILTIPNNPTNGDIFKTIFSNLRICENQDNKDYPYVEVFIGEHDSTCYPKEWWNAPYRKGGAE